MLRQAEAAHTTSSRSTRVIALDDYFLAEDDEGDMEYVWEAEMVDTYRASAIKALKKALETPATSADFSPVVVIDDTNVRLKHLLGYAQAVHTSAVTPAPALYVLELVDTPALVCAARNIHGWSIEKLEEMEVGYEPTPAELPQIECASMMQLLDPKPTETPTVAPDASEALPPSSADGAPPGEAEADGDGSGAVGKLGAFGGAPFTERSRVVEESLAAAGSADAAPLASSNGVVLPIAPSKWEQEAEEEKEEEERARAAAEAEAAKAKKVPKPPAARVSGNVELLGGLMGNYAEKRVRWADIEAAKDAEFEKAIGFQIAGTAPLSRKRMRSPPPSERDEES